MATTWIKALHRSGGSVAAALELRVDYARDAEKIDGGELVEGCECDPYTAQSEFLLSKRLYEQRTGRDQGKNDVIAYHIRMSFKHGEVTAEEALALGRELALRWTKGKHQFIVAAHTNTNNPHCHIVYNSTNLECDGKYQDFRRSAIALRKLSDRVCLEHGLSVIEKPGLSKGYNRSEYLGENKAPTVREQLRDLIDAALSAGKDSDSFFAALVAMGVEIKRGKQVASSCRGVKSSYVRIRSVMIILPMLLSNVSWASGSVPLHPMSRTARNERINQTYSSTFNPKCRKARARVIVIGPPDLTFSK